MQTQLLGILRGTPVATRARHYVGVPPPSTDGTDMRQEMAPPIYLVIKEQPDGVFLYRYDKSGHCVGDTWHADIEEAKHQAEFEYQEVLTIWDEIPITCFDIKAFALSRIQDEQA